MASTSVTIKQEPVQAPELENRLVEAIDPNLFDVAVF